MAAPHSHRTDDWWRDAVIYQVYPRSFADGDGDGTGDLAGVRARLPYLAELGVDAVWFTPWYLSPLVDGGYDVADYRTIDPAFGTLAEAEKLITEARELGIRVIVDIVPNHVSDQHAWFRAALAAGPGSPERELFHFRPGRGRTVNSRPTTGPRSSRDEPGPGSRTASGTSTSSPPSSRISTGPTRRSARSTRTSCASGSSAVSCGVRIDSAALLAKDPALADFVEGVDPHPYIDQDELHDIYRSWRAIADVYQGVFVGEVWLPDSERFARYLRPDELHTAFNFNFLSCPWEPDRLRRTIDDTLAEHAPVGAPATWVLCNHDVTRTATRYGRTDTGFDFAKKAFGTPSDLGLGTRRARAAALLTLALPGSVYVYQGEELGLPEADIPLDRIQDPMHARSEGVDPGRDGCRVPLPWTAEAPWYGFGSASEPWLPQPRDWARYAVDRQQTDPESMLALYRTALALRRTDEGFGDGPMTWLPADEGVLAFARTEGLVCVVNLARTPAALPPYERILLASGPLDAEGRLPQDTGVWLRV